jgi:excisionase family DNA binding protein
MAHDCAAPKRRIDAKSTSHVAQYLSDSDLFLTRAEAAHYLRRSVPTMERWARDGSGPAFRLVGGRALYPLDGLRRFVGVEAA